MNRRKFIKTSGLLAANAAFFSVAASSNAQIPPQQGQKKLISNPYKAVDWKSFEKHKAALHLHTIQSDGFHLVDDVVNSYRKAGYSILSITDHDTMEPNRHVKPSGAASIGTEDATPFPKDPKPNNYPANTTWKWTDYGCSAPENLGVIGIEGNELSCRKRHHINSYYNDCGWYGDEYNETGWYADAADKYKDSDKDWEDYQFDVIKEKNGLGIFCHPGWTPQFHRKPLQWYIEIFEKHGEDYLLGVEVTNNNLDTEPYDLALWDQLLARYMPNRPIWGFGNDDMHRLEAARQTFNTFLLPSLTDSNTRKAMETGQFTFCRSSRNIDYRIGHFTGFDIFPTIKSIKTDENEGTITINATNCDQILWISAPASLEPIADYKSSNKPYPGGTVVHTGNKLNYHQTAGIKNYVRAELHRKDGEHTQRTFTNPFGIFTG